MHNTNFNRISEQTELENNLNCESSWDHHSYYTLLKTYNVYRIPGVIQAAYNNKEHTVHCVYTAKQTY